MFRKNKESEPQSSAPQASGPSGGVSSGSSSGGSGGIYRIKPYHYIHVLDNNTGITSVEVGPKTFTRQDHQKVLCGPEPMIIIPPRNYCIISNPVAYDPDTKAPLTDDHGNYKIRHGDEEIRFHREPFPLYPGERILGKVNPLQVVAPDSALRLRCIRDFESGAKKFIAGDEWLFTGPATYFPRVEVQVVEIIRAEVLKPNQAMLVRARQKCIDYNGNPRRAGEEWLVRKTGSYLPGVDEEVVDIVNAYILTDKKALHLRATRTFKDTFDIQRKAGEEWLVTSVMTEAYIPDVYEEVVGTVNITTLTKRQYCIVLDPIDKNGKPQFGKKELRSGEASFFLCPGERLESGIQNVNVLSEEEALLLRAKEQFEDHAPGDRWMIHGPCEYVPPVQVEVLERRRAIPLDENEGIYVRDIKTGKVRSVIGKSYMLLANEELWEKELSPVVEQLLQQNGDGIVDRSRVVRLRVPRNAAAQIYDYKDKRSRVIFGPELVLLGPDEHFTVLSLSGGKPKRPHVIKALCLLLGPDFMTDIVTVETSDHARLQLKLSYNWRFDVTADDPEAVKIFQVPDFVGDCCKAIAARVRGAVAAVAFDQFHKQSARLIRSAVFGLDEHGKVNNSFIFTPNNLVITNIDIQSVEPVDQHTRDSLQKSVQLAIEITTKSQEAAARHEAQLLEQDARGRLERQKLLDEAENEKARKVLLQLQAQSGFVESTGQATAEAKARADAAEIEAQAAVAQAEFKAQSARLETEAEFSILKSRRTAELEHKTKMQGLEIELARGLAEVESSKFKNLVSTIGPSTIASIARAGPELQAQLLEGLGIKSLMITDGHSPINLFNTAQGLVANQGLPN